MWRKRKLSPTKENVEPSQKKRKIDKKKNEMFYFEIHDNCKNLSDIVNKIDFESCKCQSEKLDINKRKIFGKINNIRHIMENFITKNCECIKRIHELLKNESKKDDNLKKLFKSENFKDLNLITCYKCGVILDMICDLCVRIKSNDDPYTECIKCPTKK